MMEYVMQALFTTALGIITYFLKKTMDRNENTEKKVIAIEKEYITKIEHKDDVKKLEKDIMKIREDYTPKQEFKDVVKEFRQEMKDAQKQFLTKEDFYREQNKMDKKLDRILEIMVNSKEVK